MSKNKHIDPRNFEPDVTIGRGSLTLVRGDDVNGALRRVKKKLNDARVFQTLKDHEYPVSKGQARRRAKAQAIKRWQKYLRNNAPDAVR